MKRRTFITLLGGAAAWPAVVRAQQSSRVARIGWVDFVFEDDPGGRARVEVFQRGMEKLGWTLGRNLTIDYRWGIFDFDKARLAAVELLRLAPDVFFAAVLRPRSRFGRRPTPSRSYSRASVNLSPKVSFGALRIPAAT